MAMVVKWIGKKTKRPYLYHQHSYRIGKKVKTKSTYIGALSGVLQLGVKLATDAKTREKFTKTNKEILEKTPTVKSEPKVGGLGFRSNVTAEQTFQHESGTSQPFSVSGAQPSGQEDANGSEEAPP